MKKFGQQTIAALTDVITGGIGGGPTGPTPIGIYRTGPQLEMFFSHVGMDLSIGTSSRVPSVLHLLNTENARPQGHARIIAAIEAAADPRDFLNDPERLEGVVEHLNARLKFDGYELKLMNKLYRVVPFGSQGISATALKAHTKKFALDSVEEDFNRALAQADTDPAGALTSACSTVESVCKCILDEMQQPYPAKEDIQGLMREVQKHLNLSPGRTDIENDVKQVLQGLVSIVHGIGALRTHGGDAHGKGKVNVSVDARIARLAIHAASTASVFYIETWQRAMKKTRGKV